MPYDYMKDTTLTDNEKLLLGYIVSTRPITYFNLVLDNYVITSVTRRSDREYDLEFYGTEDHYYNTAQTINWQEGNKSGKFTVPANKPSTCPFGAWLPLAAIKELTKWTSSKIAQQCDYPDMAMEGDWSAIRDTETERVWEIFYNELFEEVNNG